MNRPIIGSLALAISVTVATGANAAQSANTVSNDNSATPKDNAPAASMKLSVARHIFDTSDLDKKVSACKNLNTFMNSKWVAANPIPADHTSWGSFYLLREKSLKDQHQIVQAAAKSAGSGNTDSKARSIETKIGNLYTSGMDKKAVNRAGFNPVKPRLKQIAGIDSRETLNKYLIRAFADGQGQVFQLDSSPDYKHATQVIAYVYQGGLGLPTPKYYSEKKYAPQRKAYVNYIADTFKLIGEPADKALADAWRVMEFETALAAHSLSQVAMRDPKNQYHFVSLAKASKATPNFDWKQFFAAQDADIKQGFSLSEPKFFNEFDTLLAKAPLAQWQAYLRFHAMDDAAPYLAAKFRDNHFAFHDKTLNGQPQQEPRWKQVLEAVNDAMGPALGQLYVKQYFPPEAKARAEQLVNNVRAALKQRLENVDWMSQTTRDKAIDKWGKFLPKIGYPSKWRSWEGLKITPDNFYANMEAAAKFNHDYDMAYVGQHRDRQRWGMTPQTVNAYYDPTDNTINFPAAILQPPFFYPHGDDAVNYGGIGAVIGHESSHGYDDQGSQFNGNGNNVNWWTQADRKAFNARAKKLVDQFDQYTPIPGKPGLHVNGKLTLGENIADLDGLTLAYDALQKALKSNPKEARMKIDGYTQDQRFFMAWARVWRGHTRPKALEVRLNADPHSPMKFRAIGAPSNLPAFAKAFACSKSDKMVRPADKRVEIW